MEQAIRAELWKVLDTSDLESVTSKEVGTGQGRGQGGSWARVEGAGDPPAGGQRFPLLKTSIPGQTRMLGLSSSV